jgi:mannan endo-1,4-beta-mannosidase
MKTIFTTLFIAIAFSVFSQDYLHTSGRNLVQTNGQNIVLRGINYDLIDDGNINLTNPASYQYYINEAAKTGANCIRLGWYTNGTHWRDIQTPGTVNGYVNNGHLANIVSYCISKGMFVILNVHDTTCSNDWTKMAAVLNFWTNPIIVNMINQHQDKMIVNIANEFGNVRWTSVPATSLNTFKTNYINAITAIRNAGIKVPLMIDAPDCGQSSSELVSIAQELKNNDSYNNLMFSAHAYWAGYANTTAQIQAKFTEAYNAGICFFIGEVAPNQDDASCGQISLTSIYPTVLQQACAKNYGWTAWTYDQDCSAAREMTTNGQFANLTNFGGDIVYNPSYGLKSPGGCGAVLSNETFENESEIITVYPNPTNSTFTINSKEEIKSIVAYDEIGRKIELKTTIDQSYSIENPGLYFLKIEFENGNITSKKVIITK